MKVSSAGSRLAVPRGQSWGGEAGLRSAPGVQMALLCGAAALAETEDAWLQHCQHQARENTSELLRASQRHKQPFELISFKTRRTAVQHDLHTPQLLRQTLPPHRRSDADTWMGE